VAGNENVKNNGKILGDHLFFPMEACRAWPIFFARVQRVDVGDVARTYLSMAVTVLVQQVSLASSPRFPVSASAFLGCGLQNGI